jgi:hypothetical protein
VNMSAPKSPIAESDAQERPTSPREYHAPELTPLGTLEEMTQGGGGVLDDGGSFSSLT